MIVVDTNIIVYRLIIGDKTDKTMELEVYDPDWIVPFLWHFEFLNVLSTLTKNNYLEPEQSRVILNNAAVLFKNREFQVDEESVLQFSVDNKISAYDAHYIVLAKMNNIKCVTEDKRLLKLFPIHAVSLDNFRESR